MELRKRRIAIFVSIAMASTPIFANNFNVIIKKEDTEYRHQPASTLPTPDQGVPATATNITTGSTDSGNIKKESLLLSVENGNSIKIDSTVLNKSGDPGALTGTWYSNVSLSFTKNDKTGAEFIVPDYDGDIFLTLNIADALYQENLKPIILESETWVAAPTEYGEWVITNVDQDWSPDLNTGYENVLMTQTRIVDKERTKQEKEVRPATGETRNVGSETMEVLLNDTESREEYGTLAYWEKTDPYVVTDWTVTEIFQDWSPDASTVYENTTVDQSREVKKERTIIEQEIRPATGEIRQVGSQKTDTTVLIEYQTVTGALEYWENVGEVTCTEWSFDRNEAWIPDASNYDRDQTVDQTRKVYESRECSGQQYRPATDTYRTANQEIEYRESTENRTVYGTKIDLNDWSANDSNGNWSVSNDGTYVYQSINGGPTIFESKADSYGNASIKGRIRVRSGAGDDDWVGLAFGKTDANNFYLWSWKRGNQNITGGVAYEGHFLAHVTGGVSAIHGLKEQDKTGYDALDSLISTSVGWEHGIYYNFEIKYTPTKIEVWVEGTKVVEASGSFPDGKIGFYNNSQGGVEYYKVTEEKY
jgi:hypothetical protein